ncbi:hypothetical protein JCM13664_00780 [Methylothermus subterraneus]
MKRLHSPSGLSVEVCPSGALRCLKFGDLLVNLWLGSAVEAGTTNLYLRRHGEKIRWLPLLAPNHRTVRLGGDGRAVWWAGEGLRVRFCLSLVLAESDPVWFWQLVLENQEAAPCTLDLIYVQDLGLARYELVRINEYFLSHYLDHTPLWHPRLGWAIATRQNLLQDGRHPWCLIGSLTQAVSFATDALEVFGLSLRAGQPPVGIARGLSGTRRQHEHSVVALQSAPLTLAPGEKGVLGFFGGFQPDHPQASSLADLEFADRTLALRPSPIEAAGEEELACSLFAVAPALASLNLGEAELAAKFAPPWRQLEREKQGRLWSFFTGQDSHVVLKAKELDVLRPHGHLLRSGSAWLPDEAALTSTVWMAGIFHSQLSQGYVARNLLLSTARGLLGFLRARGMRVFVEQSRGWRLLEVPSAWAVRPQRAVWLYRHAFGLIEIVSAAREEALTFALKFLAGPPCRVLIVLHLALGGDDGDTPSPVCFARTPTGLWLKPPPGSELAQRFPHGGFALDFAPGTQFERIGGDELLFADGRSRGLPYLCLLARSASLELKISGRLVPPAPPRVEKAWLCLRPAWPKPEPLAALLEILPWFAHNARIHYLSPRGLEQYTGGGWGTRDVTQGPVEWLLALGCLAPVREILRVVFANQNPDGSWPQWFSFFPRDRNLRALDAHGDIVFWPLLALGRYFLAAEDAAFLEEPVPFYHPDPAQAESAPLWRHVERALAWIQSQTVAGTHLTRYGLGDWDDSLEPAHPDLADELVSSFTAALHYQSLTVLAEGLHRLGQSDRAEPLQAQAAQVGADFQKYLIADGVLAGLVRFRGQDLEYLMHPRDRATGVAFRLVSMVQAILAGLFTPAQASHHLALIRRHLLGPDGARLADKPLSYRGGTKRLFERAETCAFFGREIGLMYTHAHLRYAEALALLGEAEEFWQALAQANPIGLRARVPQAAPRQANCYFTSSDAAFADRYQAEAEYACLKAGKVPLEGGWRVYSSGPGVFLRLVIWHLLGLKIERSQLVIDPVLPKVLDGMRIELELFGYPVEVVYHRDKLGFGPRAICLNGSDLPFNRCPNPYRLGGAAVEGAKLKANLHNGQNRLTIWLA